MKIAKYFLDGVDLQPEGATCPKFKANNVLDKRFANKNTAYFLVEIPVLRRVSPVLLFIPKDGETYINGTVFDYSTVPEEAWNSDCSNSFPVNGILLDPPEKAHVAILKATKDHWRPLTSLSFASKVLKFMYELSELERIEFSECLGLQPKKVFRAQMFIANRWQTWAMMEATPDDRVEDMKKHGFTMNDSAIQKAANRLGLESIRKLRE